MIEVRKRDNLDYQCYDLELVKPKENTLFMLLGGNGDLYWNISGEYPKILFPYVYYNFTITKEDYPLYEMFRNLYEKIVFYQMKLTDFDLTKRVCRTVSAYEKIIATEKELFTREQSKLVFGEKIVWYSEDCLKNETWDAQFPPSWVTIVPIVDGIMLQFRVKVQNEEALKEYVPDVTIRFCNNGCRYHRFNGPFMDLYNEMQSYEKKENDQIHLEEYLYLKRHKKVK